MDTSIIRTISDLIILYPELKIILSILLIKHTKIINETMNKHDYLLTEVQSIRTELNSVIKELANIVIDTI